jgi:hypothetical protein
MTDVLGSPVGAQSGDSLVLACPECGTVSTVHADRRLASDFCPTCDYPLFWARPSSSGGLDLDASDDALRRAPGASGNALSATVACPACAELNVPTAVTCVRCGSLMNPPPPPPPPPLPEPAPAPVVITVTEPCDHPPTWLVVLCTGIVAAGLTLMVVWMV